MREILFTILFLIICGILWSLPLYFCVNFVLWLFHFTYHLTLLQAFGLCLLTTVIHKLLFKNKGGD